MKKDRDEEILISKEDAIKFSFEFLTKTLKIKKHKLNLAPLNWKLKKLTLK